MTCHLPPNKANGRGHTFHANHAKKKFWDELDAMVEDGRIVLPDGQYRWARLEIRYVVSCLGDWDNRLANLKPVCDKFLLWGILESDCPRHLGFPAMTQVLDTLSEPSVTVIVHPLSEAPVIERAQHSPEETERLKVLKKARLAAAKAVREAQKVRKAERAAKAAAKAA